MLQLFKKKVRIFLLTIEHTVVTFQRASQTSKNLQDKEIGGGEEKNI